MLPGFVPSAPGKEHCSPLHTRLPIAGGAQNSPADARPTRSDQGAIRWQLRGSSAEPIRIARLFSPLAAARPEELPWQASAPSAAHILHASPEPAPTRCAEGSIPPADVAPN